MDMCLSSTQDPCNPVTHVTHKGHFSETPYPHLLKGEVSENTPLCVIKRHIGIDSLFDLSFSPSHILAVPSRYWVKPRSFILSPSARLLMGCSRPLQEVDHLLVIAHDAAQELEAARRIIAQMF
jgi:hypothetical protein